ncbi:hypothetical protein L9G15_01370 [Shewanella sp. A3A]|nr:hypothetical protein [Shewanella ferrihydritica]
MGKIFLILLIFFPRLGLAGYDSQYSDIINSLKEASDFYSKNKDSDFFDYPGMPYSLKVSDVVNKLNRVWSENNNKEYSNF